MSTVAAGGFPATQGTGEARREQKTLLARGNCHHPVEAGDALFQVAGHCREKTGAGCDYIAVQTRKAWYLGDGTSVVKIAAIKKRYFKDFIVIGDPTMQSNDFARVVPT
jgi:hypothetical protein